MKTWWNKLHIATQADLLLAAFILATLVFYALFGHGLAPGVDP